MSYVNIFRATMNLFTIYKQNSFKLEIFIPYCYKKYVLSLSMSVRLPVGLLCGGSSQGLSGLWSMIKWLDCMAMCYF